MEYRHESTPPHILVGRKVREYGWTIWWWCLSDPKYADGLSIYSGFWGWLFDRRVADIHYERDFWVRCSHANLPSVKPLIADLEQLFGKEFEIVFPHDQNMTP